MSTDQWCECGGSPGEHRERAGNCVLPTSQAATMVGWLREAACELEKAHAFLDAVGTPRHREGIQMSLAARIATMHEAV